MKKYLNLRISVAFGLIFAFLLNSIGLQPIYAQLASPVGGDFHLPAPGVMIHLSPEVDPPILKGIKVHPDNPFRFDFILDQGTSPLFYKEGTEGSLLKQEATKLIKYFLASLTIPEKDLWVNLSPYEKQRIIPQSFGLTEMGRDLLAEDYILKQITASLIYPEDNTGKKFWKRVYQEAEKKFGTTNIPVSTFNKVWIVPDKAVVYENAKAGTAYVVENKLKVMLEQDYLALSHNVIPATAVIQSKSDINAIGSQIIREIVIPELSKEVNEGKNFAQLRQVYNGVILASWYKKKIKESIFAQVYEDKKKVAGVNYNNSLPLAGSPPASEAGVREGGDIEAIYQLYLQAFKKGVYNYIKEEQDPITQQMVPRKYFSGGVNFAMNTDSNFSDSGSWIKFVSSYAITPAKRMFQATVNLVPSKAQVKRIGLAAGLATSLIMGPGYAQQNLPVLTQVEQNQADTKEYWHNLAKDDFVKVFRRSRELLNKPFDSYEILKEAALSAPYDKYYSSFEAAIEYYDQYAANLQAVEIARLALKHNPHLVFENFNNILSSPNGDDLILYGIKLDPALVLRFLDPKSDDKVLVSQENGVTNLREFLMDHQNDKIVKTILTIDKMKFRDDGTKEDLAVLMPALIDRTLTMQEAVSITKDNFKFFRTLSSIRNASPEVGEVLIDERLNILANVLAHSSKVNTYTKNFSSTELYFFLGYSTLDALSYDGRRSLFERFQAILQEHPEDLVMFSRKSLEKPFRYFLRNLAASDNLLDFLSMFDRSADIGFLESFMQESPLDAIFNGPPSDLQNLAVPLVISGYLIEKVDDTSEKERYSNLNMQIRDDLRDKLDLRNGLSLDMDGFYKKNEFIQEFSFDKVILTMSIPDIVDKIEDFQSPALFKYFLQNKEVLKMVSDSKHMSKIIGDQGTNKLDPITLFLAMFGDREALLSLSRNLLNYKVDDKAAKELFRLIGFAVQIGTRDDTRPDGIKGVALAQYFIDILEQAKASGQQQEGDREMIGLYKKVVALHIDPLRFSKLTLVKLMSYRESNILNNQNVTVLIYPEADGNHAFERQQNDHIEEMVLRGRPVLYYQIDRKSRLAGVFRDLKRRNVKVLNLVIAGHGAKTSVGLGDTYELFSSGDGDLTNLDGKYFLGPWKYNGKEFTLKDIFLPNVSIVLGSCDTGSGHYFLSDMADFMRKILNQEKFDPYKSNVFAPEGSFGLVDFIFDSKGRIINATYRDFDDEKHIFPTKRADISPNLRFVKDSAQLNLNNKGGIDLTPANMNLQTLNNGGAIQFHMDSAMLGQIQNAPGFVPVIINIQPLRNLPEFLEIAASPTATGNETVKNS